MTWSIIARDPNTAQFGIAIASRFFAVGAMCIWSEGGIGAVCTQALMNPLLGPRGLALLGEGLRPGDICDILITGDEGRDQRQVHLMDTTGASAAHTGRRCIDWCGHERAENISVAGNMLAGPEVVAKTLSTYRDRSELAMVDRLIAAMAAGEAAGGDKRGRQSAALLVQGPEPYPRLSLRVDDHGDPLAELGRLHEVAKERFLPFSLAFPTADRPYGILDRQRLEKIIEREAGKPLAGPVVIPED